MPIVKFTRHLQRYFDSLEPVRVGGDTVADVIEALEHRHPGIRDYVMDERGRLRQHVNVFVQGSMVADRIGLSDVVQSDDEIFIIQALSGG